MIRSVGSLLGVLALLSHNLVSGNNIDDENYLNKFSTKVNQFSPKFYEKLSQIEKGNFMCSPLSVYLLMSMVDYGMSDAFRSEIESVLELPMIQIDLEKGYRALMDALKEELEIQLANKLFIDQTFNVTSYYVEAVSLFFQSEISSLDFKDSQKAANTINSWCDNKTNHLIKNVISVDDLRLAELVLINAFYFKGKWKYIFNRHVTKEGNFYVNGSERSQRMIMHSEKLNVNYYTLKNIDATCIELPFQAENENQSCSMYILLPNTIGGLKMIERDLNSVKFQDLRDNKTIVNVHLPKFKIQGNLEVRPALQAMGITKVFETPDEWAYISDKPIKVTHVKQSAFIEANEHGVNEVMDPHRGFWNMHSATVKALEFNVDRPFLCVIVFKKTGTPVFYIRVTNPKPGSPED